MIDAISLKLAEGRSDVEVERETKRGIQGLLLAGVVILSTHVSALDALAITPLPPSLSLNSHDYEEPKPLDAREILPPDLLHGEYHTVLDSVTPFRASKTDRACRVRFTHEP